MKRKALYVFVFVALLLASCGGAAGGGGQPSTVRIGWSNGPDSLNPGLAWLAEAYTVYELVYDSMYDLNLDSTFTLSLADSVQRSDDGLVYTFKVKQGIKWHDGQPFTAKDIAFSYNLYKDTADFATLNSYTEHFASVEAPDDATLVLTLDQAIPNLESKLVFLYVLPEHIWASQSAVEYENPEMVGTGPFILKENKPNEFMRFAVNKDYHHGRAKVDEVIFQIFSSPDVLVQAIKTGQVDMITEMPATSVESLKDVANVKVAVGAPFAPGLDDIILNQVLPENCPSEADGGICSGHPALRDKQVRLAMAHATDKQKLIDLVMVGYATPGIALIPDGMGEWFNKDIKDFPYDVAKANGILDAAGYKDTNGDGTREMPDGSRELAFNLNWPSSSVTGPRTAELLAEMWKAIGIAVIPQAIEDDALTSKCCPALDYDIMLWGWVADPDPATLLIIPATDQIVTGYNETGFSNARYDELYVLQSTELDHAKRVKMVWEMQEIVHDNVVYIIPWYEQQIQAYRTDRFKGWLDNGTKLALEDVTSLMIIEPVK